MTQRVLLAGSTGLVGRLLRTRLAARRDVVPINLVRQGSPEPGEPATAHVGAPVELSAQLQAWITLEAAATTEAAPHPGG